MKSIIMMIVMLGVLALGMSANALIYLDEDFEGGAILVNQNWPASGEATQPDASLIAVQGVQLSCWDNTSADYTNPATVVTTTGAQDGTRFFQGAKSLRLDSTQSIGSSSFAQGYVNWFRSWQFAVSCSDDSLALPDGTRIGHWKTDYTTDGTTDTDIDVSIQLNFVVNAGKVDLILQNNGAKVGTIDGGPGSWAMVSVLGQKFMESVNPDVSGTQPWVAYDSVTSTWKGPQPLNPAIDVESAADVVATDYVQLASGMHFYLNSNSPGASITAAEIGSGWGFSDTGGVAATDQTQEVSWEIVAENGGTLFIDNIYWDGGLHQRPNRGIDRQQAARMTAFDAASSEPSGPKAADAKSWWLY